MASRFETKEFRFANNAPIDGDGDTEPARTDHLQDMWVEVKGTFTATVQVQGLIGGSAWVNVGSSVTAAAFIEVPQTLSQVRLNISGHAAGTVEAHLGGRNIRVAN